MTTIKIQITPEGKARELNRLGDQPDHLTYKRRNGMDEWVWLSEFSKNKYADLWQIWNETEKQLREFEIEYEYKIGKHNMPYYEPFEVGSIHTAEIIENKVKIID
jgi:hypothetical protein